VVGKFIAADRRISSINHLVHRIVRKDAVIVLGENSEISRASLQFFAYWAVAFCVHAVACRTTGLIFFTAVVYTWLRNDEDFLERYARAQPARVGALYIGLADTESFRSFIRQIGARTS